MAEGQIYVEVDASAINGGIAPMAIVSGNPEPVDGQSFVVVWLRWRYDSSDGSGGFTGVSWFYNDSSNHLIKHYSTEEEFKNYLSKDKPSDLNHLLGDWPAEEKAEFLRNHIGVLGDEANNCISFTAGSKS